MNRLLIFIKKIIPYTLFASLQPVYHYVFNFIAALFYGFPSNKLIVVGVTGTTGKTTVVYMTAKLLEYAGMRVGYTSTAMFSDGKKEWLNDKKMTMLGRFLTQKMLHKMIKNRCDVAIVETTSEGIIQNRHRFINYDIVVFTGLYPEHIDAHGSFENYKRAKLKLFEHLEHSNRKSIKSKVKSQKTIIVNLDDEHSEEFLDFQVERKIGFIDNGVWKEVVPRGRATEERRKRCALKEHIADGASNPLIEKVEYQFLEINKTGTKFIFADEEVQLHILGNFNAANATAVGCVGMALGISDHSIKEGLEKITKLPGRIERIDEGQNFTVIVDYAYEPVAVTKLYETIAVLEPKNIIHVLGSTGGGRDKARRRKLGHIAGEYADVVIVTNEDPYDDDPMEIITDVASGAKEKGKIKNRNLFLIEDRREAIVKAVSLACEGDIILITGKGSEQAIVTKDGILIPWDDRTVVRKILQENLHFNVKRNS